MSVNWNVDWLRHMCYKSHNSITSHLLFVTNHQGKPNMFAFNDDRMIPEGHYTYTQEVHIKVLKI